MLYDYCVELRQDSFSAVVVLTIGGSASSTDDRCFTSLTHNNCFLHQPFTVIFMLHYMYMHLDIFNDLLSFCLLIPLITKTIRLLLLLECTLKS